jgi:YYY domain-containing protein
LSGDAGGRLWKTNLRPLAFAAEAVLVCLVCLGIFLRFQGREWDEGADLHPDEYGLANTISQLTIPRSVEAYLNTRISPISPYTKYDLAGRPATPGPDNRMRWGQWPITLLRWAAETSGHTGYRDLIRTGRLLSALADSLTLFILFLIGRHLYGRRVALLAAALSALAVMQIQQSHFMTVDNWAVLFTTAALYCAARVARPAGTARQHEWKWYAAFGAATGMAVATRINLMPVFCLILCAVFCAEPREVNAGRRRHVARTVLLVALAAVSALVVFRVTQPMSFRAETGETGIRTLHLNPDWVESMRVASAESSLDAGGPPAEQWTGRSRILFPLINLVVWGMGIPLGLAALGGTILALWRILAGGEWKTNLLPLTWTVAYFLFMGTRRVMAMRYFLPIYPFLALLAAWLLMELWRKGAGCGKPPGLREKFSRHRPERRILAGAVAWTVVGGTLLWAWAFTGIYRAPNTRIEASRWLYANLAAPLSLQLATENGSLAERLPISRPASDASPGVSFRFRTHAVAVSVALTFQDGPALGSSPIRVVLSEDPAGKRPLAQAESALMAKGDSSGPVTHTVPIGPASLKPDTLYYISITSLSGSPIRTAGAVVANESWDESLPVRLDGHDPFGGLYRGLIMEMRWPDNDSKRRMLIQNLAEADFVVLPSQRALWSMSRLPGSYPMTMEYYRALFDGRLGFELAAEFSRPIEVGPLRISDLTGQVAWNRAPPAPGSGRHPFNDSILAAEEAFSVYDHAPVWIFRKGPDFRLEKARGVLEAVDLGSAISQTPKQATVAPTALMLPPDRLREQRSGGTWSQMFDAATLLNRRPLLAVLAWAGSLLLLGWLAFPLAWLAFGALPDRGYPVAKTLGLLLLAWASWIAGSFRLLPFTRWTILLGVLALAALSAGIVFRHGAQIWSYLRRNRVYAFTVEAFFLTLFGCALLLRLGNPDLWHPIFGGEKPMVFSYFNAVLKSTSFPPYDPWLAGGYMNYYYFGFVIAAQLVKLLGIVPATAYNLLLPTFFALSGTGVFCVAYNLVRARNEGRLAVPPPGSGSVGEPADRNPDREKPALPKPAPREGKRANPILAGMLSVIFVLILGNLGQGKVIADALQRASGRSAAGLDLGAIIEGSARAITTGFPLSPGNWYWDASRIVAAYTGGNEINEFPFFTLLYGDLHPHMLDTPFLVLALAWALAYLLGGRKERRPFENFVFWGSGALALGATRVTNMWDFPACLALCGAGIITAQWWSGSRVDREMCRKIVLHLAMLIGSAFLLYLPFDQWFASPLSALEWWHGVKTPLPPYLLSHGLFLFVLVSWMICETVRWLKETPASVATETERWLKPVVIGITALFLGTGFLLGLQVEAALVAVPLIAWCGLLLLRSRASLGLSERIIVFLPGVALGLTLLVEVCAVGGDRMNTFFKFYLQVWLLFGLAAGPALAWIWVEKNSWATGWRRSWTAAFCLLAAVAALYPITAVFAKIQDRFPPPARAGESVNPPDCLPIPDLPAPMPPAGGGRLAGLRAGLDGMAYMQWGSYCDNGYAVPLAYDYEAIRWMQANIPGSPVIVEAQSPNLYRLSSRYSWNTGLPDVVGWDWHQRQQRAATDTRFITERGLEVTRFYSHLGIEEALAFLRKYQVSYIVVGPLEKSYYRSSGGLGKFEAMMEQGLVKMAYRNPGVSVYQVVGH